MAEILNNNAPKTKRIHPSVKRDRKHRSYRSKTGQPQRVIPPYIDYPSHPDDPRLLLPPPELRPFAPVIWAPNPIEARRAAKGAVARNSVAHAGVVNSARNLIGIHMIHGGHHGSSQPRAHHPIAAHQIQVNWSDLNPADAKIPRAVSRGASVRVISKPSTPEPDELAPRAYPEGDSRQSIDKSS